MHSQWFQGAGKLQTIVVVLVGDDGCKGVAEDRVTR